MVIHYPGVAGGVSAISNTFQTGPARRRVPRLPNVCSHYAVWASAPYPSCRRGRDPLPTVGLDLEGDGRDLVAADQGRPRGRPAQLNGSLQLVQWLRCRSASGQRRDEP